MSSAKRVVKTFGAGTAVLTVLMGFSAAIVFIGASAVDMIPTYIQNAGLVTIFLACMISVIWLLGRTVVEDNA